MGYEEGYGTVCTKTSSSWDDLHKQIPLNGTIHPGTIRKNGKKVELEVSNREL